MPRKKRKTVPADYLETVVESASGAPAARKRQRPERSRKAGGTRQKTLPEGYLSTFEENSGSVEATSSPPGGPDYLTVTIDVPANNPWRPAESTEDLLDKIERPRQERTEPDGDASAKESTPPASPARARMTFRLPAQLCERARDLVWHLCGPPAHLTLSRLAQEALEREIARLEVEFHGGRPFPRRDSELAGGRPISGSTAG